MSKNKKKYIDLHKTDPKDDDIYIKLPCTPVKWITYNFDCKDDEEIAIDIGTGKASVRKQRELNDKFKTDIPKGSNRH